MLFAGAPVAQAGVKACAYVKVTVNGEEVVNEQRCNEIVAAFTPVISEG